MKTKRPAAASNQLANRYGFARFYAPLRAKSAWSDPNVPEYKPNWMARFRVGGRTWEESAGPCYPVADGLRAVKVWAETRMETELAAARAGKLDAMQAVVRPARTVMLDELGRVYLSAVPPGKVDYKTNYARLCAIATRVTGREIAEIEVTDAVFCREHLTHWARMTQEHFRRGWSVRGAEPADAWQRLRTELKSGRLAAGTEWPKIEDAELLKVLRSGVFPGVDKTTVMECNTTINTYLRCAKAVFANNREYLPGLVLPGLEELLKFTVNVAAPEGHREFDPAVLAALQADAPRLAREEPKVWAFNRIIAWAGARPGVIKKLPGSALRVLGDGTGVIMVPAAKGGMKSSPPVDAECVAALMAVKTDASLIGARHKTEAKDIHNAHNAWMTSHGMTGTLKSYVFRHVRLDQYREVFDSETAAALGGHRSTAMVEKKYTQNRKVIPMLVPGLKTA